MIVRIVLIASAFFACSLTTGGAHAALQGRDLDGNVTTFEAYYDTDLDITWLADADYGAGSSYDDGYNPTDGKMTWASAKAWAANLSIVDTVNNITYDRWRLPTLVPVNGVSFDLNFSFNGTTDVGYNITSPNSELAYMFYVNLGNPGAYTPTGVTSGCYNPGNTCLDNVGPFSNLQLDYWFAKSFPSPDSAWNFRLAIGDQSGASNVVNQYAWAVSTGDIAAIPEAQTYALMLAGLGLIAWRVQRRGSPPRVPTLPQ